MLTRSLFPVPASRPVAADSAVPVQAVTDMERLALVLLQTAGRHEIEAGLVLHITPALLVEELAALAGIGGYGAGLLLDYLMEAGFVLRRRQRFVLADPAALYRLALGAAPL